MLCSPTFFYEKFKFFLSEGWRRFICEAEILVTYYVREQQLQDMLNSISLGEGLKYSSNIGQNNESQSFFVGGTLGFGEGGCGTSPELIVLGVKIALALLNLEVCVCASALHIVTCSRGTSVSERAMGVRVYISPLRRFGESIVHDYSRERYDSVSICLPSAHGSDIGIQEKKAKLFNEWERFTSTDGESIESYYHRFSKLMNDFKRNKHFPENHSIPPSLTTSHKRDIDNKLQPEWSRHVTIVHQTKDLHTTDYTQLYDFLKYNQKEVDDQRAERLAKTHDPLALMQLPSSFQTIQLQNVGNQVVQDAVQNQGVQNFGNQNGQIGVQNIGMENRFGHLARYAQSGPSYCNFLKVAAMVYKETSTEELERRDDAYLSDSAVDCSKRRSRNSNSKLKNLI
ncbi:hypothetical protein Tco_1500505 [Tanacetum coccineum]